MQTASRHKCFSGTKLSKKVTWQQTAIRPRATGVGLRLRTAQHRLELGSSPETAITLPADPEQVTKDSPLLATPPVPDTTSLQEQAGPRRSLRVITQGEPASTMTKAVKRKGAAAPTTGLPLVTNFPYHRLTLDQIESLFQVYQITLGTTVDERKVLITMIQNMDRAQFETAIKAYLARDRTQPLKDFLAQFSLQVVNTSDTLVSQ